MPTTSQPAAGTAVPSTTLTASLLYLRNEAETDVTIRHGSSTRFTNSNAATAGTDADGRYRVHGGASCREDYRNMVVGPERTLMAIVKRVAAGAATHALIDSDFTSGLRAWQFNMANATGAVSVVSFNTGGSTTGAHASAANVSTTNDDVVIWRIRNDAGTYRSQIWVGATAATETALTGTPRSTTTGDSIAIFDRISGSQACSSQIYLTAAWGRALSDSEVDFLTSRGGWGVFDTDVPGGSTYTPRSMLLGIG